MRIIPEARAVLSWTDPHYFQDAVTHAPLLYRSFVRRGMNNSVAVRHPERAPPLRGRALSVRSIRDGVGGGGGYMGVCPLRTECRWVQAPLWGMYQLDSMYPLKSVQITAKAQCLSVFFFAYFAGRCGGTGWRGPQRRQQRRDPLEGGGGVGVAPAAAASHRRPSRLCRASCKCNARTTSSASVDVGAVLPLGLRCPETAVGKLDYSQEQSVSFACPERAPGAVRIAARRPEIPGILLPPPETVVGKLDQPPVPSAPSARPDRAPGGGGRAARGADLRAGMRHGHPPKKTDPSPPHRATHPPIHRPAPPQDQARRLHHFDVRMLGPSSTTTTSGGPAAAGRAAASRCTRNRQFSPSARFRLRMAETNTCGSKANAPGPGAGRCRSDAEGGHLAAKNPVSEPVGIPSGSDMAPRRHPQGVGNFVILVDFDTWWTPKRPPPPRQRHGRAGRAGASPGPTQRDGRAGRMLPAGPQHPQAPGIANSALARVLGSGWRTRIPACTAAPRQMHRAPGLDGGDRTQKGVANFEILVDFAAGLPRASPPPQRDGRAGRQLPAGPQRPQAPGIANSALARVLGSEWRKRIPA
eukprot:gene15735-biopygen5212